MPQLSKFKKTELGEIPEEWNINRLEEISTITRLAGYEYTEYWKPNPNGSIIALRGFNISGNKLDLRNVERITEELSLKLKRSKLYKDDIVFPCVGSIGNAVLIEENNKYHINQNIAKLTANSTIFPLFLTHILLSDITKRQIIRFNASTSQPNVLVGNLRKFLVPIPPFNEQKIIASILSNVDGLIQKTDQITEQTQRLKKGLMQKLLTKGIGHTKFKAFKSLFGKYEEIPKDWEIKTFGELFEFLRAGTNSRDDLEESGDVQYIHYGDIHAKWHSILDCNLEKIPWIDKAKVQGLPLLKEGDLIIADASEDYEGSGASVLLKNVKNRKIVSGLHTIPLRNINDDVFSNFKTYLNSIRFVKNQIIAYVTGISVYGLSKNNLRKIRIPLPPSKEQQKISSVLSNVDSLIQKQQNNKSNLANLKKGLMQQLLTGKIRVKV